MVNGLLLFGAEALRRRAPQTDEDDDTRIAKQVQFPERSSSARRRRWR